MGAIKENISLHYIMRTCHFVSFLHSIKTGTYDHDINAKCKVPRHFNCAYMSFI